MASEIYNGKLLRFKFDAKKLMHATSCKLDFSTKLEEIATKDTDGTVSIPSNYTWSGSAEALLANLPTGDTTHVSFNDILTKKLSGAQIDIEFTTDKTGDVIYSGKAYIESASITADVGSSAKVSISFKGNGNLNQAIVV
ncbi:phage tail tube protein [Flavobacterium aestivum]|uniref:phage tail tube protein n=1 Tax=Flavobacterium aestivum TaxID=3003257 RepID=UPI0022867E9D|nr:phage tail tube protein [Flavobacterium aestivum]